jgi:hypothetical protein
MSDDHPYISCSERGVDEARCHRRLRAVTHGPRSDLQPRVVAAVRRVRAWRPADPAACPACPWRGAGVRAWPGIVPASGIRGPARAVQPSRLPTSADSRRGHCVRCGRPWAAAGGPQTAGRTDWFVPPAGRAVPPAGPRSPAVRGSPEGTHHAGTGWSRWQAGHASPPNASFAQPAATARARLSASPSAAGSAKAAWHPATAQQAAGTRIWSPMTQRPVIATG